MSFTIVDFQSGGANLAVGAASTSAALPSGNKGSSQTYGITCTGNAHIRIGVGAQTALATDPMIAGNGGVFLITVPPGADTIAAIQETAGSVLNVFRVMEG